MLGQQFEATNSVSDKVIKNTAYNIAGRSWFILVAFFLTPYIVRHIGLERYAIWSFVSVITGYFSLFDFGIGLSFVKYIAEFFAKKEYEKINQILNAGFIFYAVFAVFILAISVLYIDPIIGVFKIPAGLYQEAAFVFLVGIAIFVLANALSPFAAIQAGLQRLDISNTVNILLSIVNIAGTVLVIEKGWGLRGLILNNAVVFFIHSGINIVIAARLLPFFRFRLSFYGRDMLGKLFKFGYRIQIARISSVVTTQTDKILIAYFVGLGWVTYYQLGSSIIYYAMAIPSLIVSALIPAFSEVEAKGERPKLIEAYLRSTKYLAFCVAPVFVFLILASPNIMLAWMGKGFEKSVLIIKILSASWLINTLAQVAASVCIAIDQPQIMANGSIIIAGLNILFSIVLVKLFGFYGIAWGTLLSVNAGTVYFLFRLHKALAVSFSRLIRVTSASFLASFFAAAGTYAVYSFLAPMIITRGRLTALVVLLAQGAVFSILYLLGAVYARLFNRADMEFFAQKFTWIRFLLPRLFAEYGKQ